MSLLRPDEQQQLTGLLLQLPNIDDPAERQALLDNLPQGLQNSIPHSDQATVHIANIVAVTGADAWNPLPDGSWAILVLIDTAAALVEGSTLATDLQAQHATLQERAATLPPRPAAAVPPVIPPAVAAAPVPAAPRSLLLSPPRVYFLGVGVVAVVLCAVLGIIGALTPPAVPLTPIPTRPAPTAPPTVTTREYHWEHYDTDLAVNKDGSFDVVDTQIVSFTKGTFQSGYRGVPVQDGKQVGDYQVAQITDQGVRIPYTLYNGSYDLKAGHYPPARTFVTLPEGANFNIYWFNDPVVAPARFIIEVRYHVRQALRLDPGGDQLTWKSVPTGRTVVIDHSRVRVQLPADVPMADVRAQIHPEGIAAIGIAGSTVTFDSARQIQPNETIDVQVQWPHGLVGVP